MFDLIGWLAAAAAAVVVAAAGWLAVAVVAVAAAAAGWVACQLVSCYTAVDQTAYVGVLRKRGDGISCRPIDLSRRSGHWKAVQTSYRIVKTLH